jgi:hypothetical protein
MQHAQKMIPVKRVALFTQSFAAVFSDVVIISPTAISLCTERHHAAAIKLDFEQPWRARVMTQDSLTTRQWRPLVHTITLKHFSVDKSGLVVITVGTGKPATVLVPKLSLHIGTDDRG